MDSPPPNPPAAGGTGYYVWAPEGKDYAVHLHSEIIDRMNYEVLRGFGALPKRGAEVGGVLLGSAERSGERLIVRVMDFQLIPCEHLMGPSYVLSGKDLLELDNVLQKSAKAGPGEPQVVGFFRSITRDPIQLTPQDLELLESRFPADGAVCLLVKPYNTRPNEAVLLCREHGGFSSEPQTQPFVFRRKEMGVGPAVPRERIRRPEPAAQDSGTEAGASGDATAPPPAPAPDVEPPVKPEIIVQPDIGDDIGALMIRQRKAAHQPSKASASDTGALDAGHAFLGSDKTATPRGAASLRDQPEVTRVEVKRSRWVWVPLSFIFLVLGVVLGFELGLGFYRAQNLSLTGDPYGIDLAVSRFGDSYHLKWNPSAVAVRSARRGELLVEESGTTKQMNLAVDDLARGGLVYRGGDQPLRFRLTLFVRERGSYSELGEIQPPAR